MTTNVQFANRSAKVSSLEGRVADFDAQLAAQDERIKARESEIRSLQVEQGQRTDPRGDHRFPAQRSPQGQQELHALACRIVELRNEIIDIKGARRAVERRRNLVASELKFENDILEAAAPRIRDHRPIRRL